MPNKNVSYSCCICGERFKTFEEAEACEKAHKVPKKVSKPEYDSFKDRKSDFPLSILVYFTDGTSARYYRK